MSIVSYRHLVLLHLLASMSEGLGEKLIQDVVQVTTLLRVRPTRYQQRLFH